MTEEELVEKVARAIWASEYNHAFSGHNSAFPETPILESYRKRVMEKARAAIAAMREAGWREPEVHYAPELW